MPVMITTTKSAPTFTLPDNKQVSLVASRHKKPNYDRAVRPAGSDASDWIEVQRERDTFHEWLPTNRNCIRTSAC